MEAHVTISRNNQDEIRITIGDRSGGLRVVEVKMGLKDFALAVTGLGYAKAEFAFVPNQFLVDNILKEKQVIPMFVDKVKSFNKEDQIEAVKSEFIKAGWSEDGWMVFDDGTRTQQHGGRHKALLYRFVDPS